VTLIHFYFKIIYAEYHSASVINILDQSNNPNSDGSSGGAGGAQAPLPLEIQWSPVSLSYKFEEEE
jgi:hypothetical protein